MESTSAHTFCHFCHYLYYENFSRSSFQYFIITGVIFNTLTSIQGFYRVFGSIPVGRLPGTIKGPFKATRYCLEG